MVLPGIDRPDLPEYMTWEELERLPADVADQIELWEGPDGVTPLRPANYLLVGEWTHDDEAGIAFGHPFDTTMPWSALAF
ncbi:MULTISPECIES: hypothetical protein [Nocardia]|uniref:hypothetical protein n=1 Tax=Nocardia TaxID=1817 RepID=UPI000302AF4B|nr:MULTISPECIES: hypothetical protein [Nocardia]